MTYKNIVATIGTYQKGAENKYITRTVGQLVDTKYGQKIKLDASFSPAGCVKDDSGQVWLSLYDPKPKQYSEKGDMPDDNVPF